MLKLNYQIEVNTTANIVWNALIQSDKYKQWAVAFSPNSQFTGDWRVGEQVLFFDPDLGGTKAVVDRIDDNQHLEYHHIGIFGSDKVQQIDSDSARKWIGSRETYQIEETEQGVLLSVTIETHPDFVAMFNSGWEKALPMIKLLCEQET
ncbi:SRPBCC family protein [Vibrio sp. M260118]|uniref:SRPBCC family protein n=1 Tax=Vibrio sp. M260118 TaxID=3020896 RepID=UPI002F3FF802